MQPVRTTHDCSLWKGIIARWDYFGNHVLFDVGIEDRFVYGMIGGVGITS